MYYFRTPGPSTPQAQPPAGGLFGFGAKPADPAKTADAGTTAASSTPKEAPKSTGLFSMPTASAPAKDDVAKIAEAPTVPKPGTASLFGNLGAKPAGTTGTNASTAPAVPSLLGGTPAASSMSAVPSPSGATAPAAAKVSAAPEPAPSVVKGKTFNEIVERFEAELEDQVSRFKDQAAEVREWDMILIDNSQNVSISGTELFRVRAKTRHRIDCSAL